MKLEVAGCWLALAVAGMLGACGGTGSDEAGSDGSGGSGDVPGTGGDSVKRAGASSLESGMAARTQAACPLVACPLVAC
jgi:hypothetical protein